MAFTALLLHTAAHTLGPDKLGVEGPMTDSKHSWGNMSNPAGSNHVGDGIYCWPEKGKGRINSMGGRDR